MIDKVYGNGGGVIVVPAGTYMTGSLFLKQGVHLYVSEGGVLKRSDDINDYKLKITRIEGETCLYYCALINAEGVDGFTIRGPGTIDGNGLKSWKAFWLRIQWNPACTNKDEQRPRLVYVSNSRNVLFADVHFINSHFWTTHIYKCDHVKYLNCHCSIAKHFVIRDCKCECDTFFNVMKNEEQYHLSDFVFENLEIRAKIMAFRKTL